jgi:hypothetical protein
MQKFAPKQDVANKWVLGFSISPNKSEKYRRMISFLTLIIHLSQIWQFMDDCHLNHKLVKI